MEKINVLVVGGGGREDALAWKLRQSRRLGKLYVAPGNGGTSRHATNVPIKAIEIEKLVAFAKGNDIGLTVVGPDDPLADGIVDAFEKERLRAFGPTKAAAEIEASKDFAKELMVADGIPTARHRSFRAHCEARSYVIDQPFPLLVKADGLCLGKGAKICTNLAEAEQALDDMMSERLFGKAGEVVIIEEYLDGPEVSLQVFCDRNTSVVCPALQDHKPIWAGNTGPMTGGMGTITPVPWVTPAMLQDMDRQCVRPALAGMARLGRHFRGLFYPGLKESSRGRRVLEYNARFGDPECQPLLLRLKTDLLDIFEACVDDRLAEITIEWHEGFAVCIVVASEGYPGDYSKSKGRPIYGLEEAERISGVQIFHAGTVQEECLKAIGGRVLGVSALADTLRGALDLAYGAIRYIKLDGMQFRDDIGQDALARMALLA